MAGAAGAVPLTYPQLLMTGHQQTAPAAGFLPAQVCDITLRYYYITAQFLGQMQNRMCNSVTP